MKVLAILLLLTLQARAEHVDCEKLRAAVKWYGKEAVNAKAVAMGKSKEEISRIRKLCGI